MSRLHPDLRLGVVLVVAALLLALGAPRVLFGRLMDDLDLGAGDLGFATIGTANWLDRRGPHPMMALGGAIAVVGTLLLLIASNVPILGLANFVRGVGGAGFASVILYGVVVKGATHHRGLLLGAVIAVAVGPWEIAHHVGDGSNVTGAILFSAVLTGIAAYVLYQYLPRVFKERAVTSAGSDAEPESLREVFATPGFWRTFGQLLTVASIAVALSSTTFIFLPFMLDQMDTELDWPIFFVVLPVLSAVAAISIGAASDRISARQLLIALAIAVVGLMAASAMFDGWLRAVIAGVASPLARGGIAVLPWVLLAQLITVRHFAVVGLIMFVLSGFLGGFLPAFAGFSVDALGSGAWLYAVHLPFAVALLAASFWVAKHPLSYGRAEAQVD